MKKIIAFLFASVLNRYATAQLSFSIATDASVLHSFTPRQTFTVFGQGVHTHFHITPKEGAYASISYYTNGSYQNRLTAVAKLPINPLFLNYTVQSSLRFRQLSLGWKHYWKGGFESEEYLNLYSLAGFGMLWGRAINTFNPGVDTAKYQIPQRSVAGIGTINRLTFDVGAGGEMLLGGGLYLYGEARTWLQASDFPSPYLYNNNIPRVLTLNAGMRILLY